MSKAMNHRVSCWMLVAGLVGWAVPLYGFDRKDVEQSVVRIFESGEGQGSGTVINAQGDVLTNQHVSDGSHNLSVGSKFSDGRKPAQIVWESPDKDLAIIRARGLDLPHAPLFSGQLEGTPPVYAMGYPGAADHHSETLSATLTGGMLSHAFPGVDWAVTILQHSATVSGGNSGGPLFDDCGRVIGVNTRRPHVLVVEPGASGLRQNRVPNNAAINWASHIQEAIGLLREEDIQFEEDASPCVPATGGSDPEAARAAAEAKQSAEQAGSRADQASQEAQQAQTQAEQATQAVEEVVQAGRLTNTLTALVAVVTFVALGLALRKPRQQIIRVAGQVAGKVAAPLSQLVQSVRPRKPAIALTGFDAQGRPVTLRLSRTDLDRKQGGFTVGRHPLLVDHVLDGDRLSKRHARFSDSDGSVFVEDLNSSNGTSVNGTACSPFQPVQIRPGDMVDVGDIALRVSS